MPQVMHYSRVSTPPSLSYPPASAVLLNELLTGGISFLIALACVPQVAEQPWHRMSFWTVLRELSYPWTAPFQRNRCSLSPSATSRCVLPDHVPDEDPHHHRCLSVALLRRKLSPTKWLSLFFFAIGVGINQILMSTLDQVAKNVAVGSAHDSALLPIRVMSPLTGFGAIIAACFTSGLVGVYFEMGLKNPRADLWFGDAVFADYDLDFGTADAEASNEGVGEGIDADDEGEGDIVKTLKCRTLAA
ncbi:hypothetical protein B0H17DRAFT_1212871 [Mycena rosella]|uniref:Uncharacterized protein n=1 Tax=Mycena rosella TaxID=1033263 RepID=A0AAD7G5S8_MYCRO|nr:hypothetical protein B0H17DRAFT_1212871 [Mycena rosella]